MFKNIKTLLLFIMLMAVLIFPFYPPNARCKEKGGTYFLNGDCVRFDIREVN